MGCEYINVVDKAVFYEWMKSVSEGSPPSIWKMRRKKFVEVSFTQIRPLLIRCGFLPQGRQASGICVKHIRKNRKCALAGNLIGRIRFCGRKVFCGRSPLRLGDNKENGMC